MNTTRADLRRAQQRRPHDDLPLRREPPPPRPPRDSVKAFQDIYAMFQPR